MKIKGKKCINEYILRETEQRGETERVIEPKQRIKHVYDMHCFFDFQKTIPRAGDYYIFIKNKLI